MKDIEKNKSKNSFYSYFYHGAFNEEEENMPFLSEEKNTFYQNLVKERRTLNSKKSTIQSIYQSYLDQKVYTLS